MSKKNKSKFKRQIKAQLAQEMAQAQIVEAPKKSVPTPPTSRTSPASPTSSPAATTISVDGLNVAQIKYDLKKTGIIVASLAVIMAILYYLDRGHGTLLSFGDWLFRVLHIG